MMAAKPFVFVAMPFGKKRDPQTATDIDFDAIFEAGVKPAVKRFDVDCLRADEERAGGVIHLAMFERLLLAEIAIVDVTNQNANVFYELGVRHAARPRSTIIIRANGTALPFDINMLRALSYRLEGGVLTPDAALELQNAIAFKLEHALSELEVHDSPLFQLIPQFPGITLSHEVTENFRDRARYIDGTRDRLSAATRLETGVAAYEAIRAIEAEIGPVTEANAEVLTDVVLSYRDVKAWSAMIDLIDRFPPAILRRTLTLREQYALALNRRNGPGDRRRALEILEEVIAVKGDNPESCALAGRIYKDLYDEAKERKDRVRAAGHLDSAIDWYRRGFQADPRDYYPGINLASLLAIADTEDSLDELRRVAPAVAFAVARLGGLKSSDYWLVATVFEAAVLSSDWKIAERALARMVSVEPKRWMLETTTNNLRLLRASSALDTARIDALLEDLEAATLPIAPVGAP
jgi:tetratricopeptide (TPR) repeat protein